MSGDARMRSERWGVLRWEGLFLPGSWGLWGVLIKKARDLTDVLAGALQLQWEKGSEKAQQGDSEARETMARMVVRTREQLGRRRAWLGSWYRGLKAEIFTLTCASTNAVLRAWANGNTPGWEGLVTGSHLPVVRGT